MWHEGGNCSFYLPKCHKMLAMRGFSDDEGGDTNLSYKLSLPKYKYSTSIVEVKYSISKVLLLYRIVWFRLIKMYSI